jgi:steroid 5-alpha reductase family enzyme
MTLFLLRVSGVTLLEKTLATTKPGYEEYVESTSAFIPWFPRKKA